MARQHRSRGRSNTSTDTWAPLLGTRPSPLFTRMRRVPADQIAPRAIVAPARSAGASVGSVAGVLVVAISLGPAFAIAAVVGYLLGSVPVAVLVGQRQGIDLRSVGDRNPGYWNAKQQLPRRAAMVVFVGDVAKGAGAGLVGLAASADGRWWIAYLAVGAAMLGHAWPLFARFRGGRSILTFAGGACVVAPRAALAAVVLTIVVAVGSRSFAWGARAGVFGYPLLQAFVDPRARVAATGCLMAIIGLRFAMAAAADRRGATTEASGALGASPRRSGPARS